MRPSKVEFLRRFVVDSRGSVAITFALVSIVIFGMVALGVDGSNVSRAKYGVQQRLDLAALAAARVYADSSADPQQTAQKYFERDWVKLSLAGTPALNVSTSRDSDSGDHIVRLETTTNVNMSFARVLGINSMEIRAKAEARVSMPFTEIALALDTTKSMDGGKLDDLKSAARRLVDDVYDMPQARGRIKFSLVPFAQYVNVGQGYRTADWMDVPPDGTYWDANLCWDHYPIISQTNCRQTTCTWWNDGTPVSYACTVCDTVYGPPERRCGANVTNFWNGCAGSRNYPMNMTPIANASSRIPGIPNVQCGTPLLRLTDHESRIRNAIDDMTAVGETYITAGIEWGWRTLAAEGPFGDARPRAGVNSARKILVLMTDGANTRSPNYPNHEGWNGSQSNQLMSEICTKAKQDGVEIFTVAFAVNDNNIKDLLRQCAHQTSRFYDADTRNDLYSAFATIAKQLVQTRISK